MRLALITLLVAHAAWLGAQQPVSPVAGTCAVDSTPVPTPSWPLFQLPDSLGTIPLPPGTVAGPLGNNPDGRQFILEDSTLIELWVTPEPVGGLMASSQVRLSASTNCRATIGGRPTVINRLEFTKPGGTIPSAYVGIANIVLDSTHTINLTVTTATASSRDEALRFLTLLRIRASRP